jgi:hypothetical protein
VLVAGVLLARAGLGAPSWRFAGAHSLAAPSVLGPGERRAFTLAEPAAGAAARLRVHLARTLGSGAEAGAPAEIEITAARADGGERTIVARLATRARIEIELPPGLAPLEVAVAHRAGSSAALLDERTFELWSAGPREGWAVLEIALRAAVALGAGAALALGLGAWMSAPSAAALVLCAWACSTALDDARAWIPGARLVRDLEFLSAGRVCEAIDPRWIGGGAAIAIAGCALAALGLRSWSSPP